MESVGTHAVYVCKVHQEGDLDTEQQHLERHRGLLPARKQVWRYSSQDSVVFKNTILQNTVLVSAKAPQLVHMYKQHSQQ